MLYSNIQKIVIVKKFKFGNVLGITLGDNTLEVFIPIKLDDLKVGDSLFNKFKNNLYFNEKLGIGFSKNNPIIVSSETQKCNGIILSSGIGTGSDEGDITDIDNAKILAVGAGNNWTEVLLEPMGMLTAHVHTTDGNDYYLKYKGAVVYKDENDTGYDYGK
ncbi:MAG: hypothetical protein QXV17_01620 [Candidatus Micrarchaeaceae archaeon]